jgi:hypothetical protein
MPLPLSFEHLQAILRQHTAALPDFRNPSPNTRYTVQGAALARIIHKIVVPLYKLLF